MNEKWQPSQDDIYGYVQRRSTPEQEQRIEVWLLENPQSLGEFVEHEWLREGLRSYAAGKLRDAAPGGWWRKLWPGHWQPGWGYGVPGVFAMIALVVSVVFNQQLADDKALLQAQLAQQQLVGSVVLYPQLRLTRSATSRQQELRLPQDASSTVFRVALSARWLEAYSNFELELQSGNETSRLADVTPVPAERGSELRLVLDGHRLRSGDMTLTVYGMNKEGSNRLAQFVIPVIKP